MSKDAKVFISHAGEDLELAKQLCTSLEQRGLSCWIAPRDVVPGIPYAEAIVAAIPRASVMIVVLSRYANASSMVAREVERAGSANISIIPFRVEPVLPAKSLEFFLSERQWIDAFEGPWNIHVDRVVSAVAELVTDPQDAHHLRSMGVSSSIALSKTSYSSTPAFELGWRHRFVWSIAKVAGAIGVALLLVKVSNHLLPNIESWADNGIGCPRNNSAIAVKTFLSGSNVQGLGNLAESIAAKLRLDLAAANVDVVSPEIDGKSADSLGYPCTIEGFYRSKGDEVIVQITLYAGLGARRSFGHFIIQGTVEHIFDALPGKAKEIATKVNGPTPGR